MPDRRSILVAIAACLIWVVSPAALGQRVDPLDVTGRDFAGISFGNPIAGGIRIGAMRGAVWSEETAGGQTQRLLVEGDVRVDLGLYQFSAAKAVIWLSRREALGQGIQAAAYFDRVRDPGGEPGVAQSADRLLVTGTLDGEVTLLVDATTRGRPRDRFLDEAERRLSRFLLRSIGAEDFPPMNPPPPPPPPIVQGDGALRPGVSQPYEPGSAFGRPTSTVQRVPPEDRAPPIFAKSGVFTFAHARRQPIRFQGGEEEDLLLITDGAIVAYRDVRKDRSLQLTAQRVVAFIASGTGARNAQFSSDSVRGVYLEGDVVATDGQYTLRGPRMYYDVAAGQAIVLDAVFHTFDTSRQVPLYLRASTIRQEAQNRFSGTDARLAMSAFFQPHFALGSTDITVTREPQDEGPPQTIVDAKNLTLRAGGVPFFYFPRFKGNIDDVPLRSFSVENASGSGAIIRTAWDIFGLTGIRAPDGVNADILIDGHVKRGAAFGLDASWNREGLDGSLFTYMLPNDTGTDYMSSGARIREDDTFRGAVWGEHRVEIDENWTGFVEGSYISDERFTDVFFESLAETRREFTNQAYFRRLEDNTAVTFRLKGAANDFTPNEYLLQSQGYNTDQLPELAAWAISSDVFGSRAPGLLSYSGEIRAGRVKMNFTEPTAEQLGFNTNARSIAAFGILPDETIGDQLRAQGYTEGEVYRADTRHELDMAFDLGPVRVNPFVVGRLTAWDNAFDEFSPDETKRVRAWLGGGVRMSTTIQRVNNSVSSRLFDLNRIRHIIEPNVTVWTAGSSISQTELPVYNDRIESLATGTAVRVGVDQTFQTQRGGPGRWHSVDVLKLSHHFVFSSQDTDDESPIRRFYDARPEYSLLGGDFAETSAVWQVTDAVALSVQNTYDMEIHQNATTSAGGLVKHGDDFSAYAEVRYVNARNVTFLNLGVAYRLTEKYLVEGRATYDTDEREFQSVGGTLRRRFPDLTLGISLSYSEISDQTRFGVVFEPDGLGDRSVRLRQLGQNQRGSSGSLGG